MENYRSSVENRFQFGSDPIKKKMLFNRPLKINYAYSCNLRMRFGKINNVNDLKKYRECNKKALIVLYIV